MPNDEEIQLVVFKLLEEEFAAPISQVREVIRIPELTRMPRAQSYVAGLLNLRGKVFPVIDLKKRFRMASREKDARTRIMVIDMEEQSMGLLVDEVREVLRAAKSSVEASPALIADATGPYLQGVVKLEGRLVLLLNLDRLFSSEELEELQQSSLSASQGEGQGGAEGLA